MSKIPTSRIDGVEPHAHRQGDEVIVVVNLDGVRRGLRFSAPVLDQVIKTGLVGLALRGSRRGPKPKTPWLTNYPPLEFAAAAPS